MRRAKRVAVVLALASAGLVGAAEPRGTALRGNPAQWFGPDAYPPEAIRAGEQGRVVARLSVDARGRVADCVVETSSGSEPLDRRTCEIALARVTFDPARNDRGRAIASTYYLPVRWVLPTGDEQPIPPELRAIAEAIAALPADDRNRLMRAGQESQNSDCAAALRDASPLLMPGRLPPASVLPGYMLADISGCELRHGNMQAAYALAVRATRTGIAPDTAWRLRLYTELQGDRTADAVSTVEELARGSGAVLNALDVRYLWALVGKAKTSGQAGLERRLLKVLAESYSPDPIDGDADPFRYRYAQLLVAGGDREGARTVLRGVALPSVLHDMMLDLDLRDSLPAGVDLKAATERRLVIDQALVESHPDRLSPLLEAATGLRRLGRPAEAMQLLEGARGRVEQRRFTDLEQFRPWWWDGLYRTAMMLGRTDEAIGFLRSGIGVGEDGGRNVSQVLNLAAAFNELGRPRDALATLADAGQPRETSPYGQMVLRMARGCANAQLGNAAAAAADRAYMEAHRADGPGTVVELLLCMGDQEAAAADVIARLRDPRLRADALAEFSTYAPPPVALPVSTVERNRRAIAVRPDVRAALAAAGGVRTFNTQDFER